MVMLVKLTLVSEDGIPVDFAPKVAMTSPVLAGMIEECREAELELPVQMTGATLNKVLAYVTHHYNNRGADIEKPLTQPVATLVSDWDARFLEQSKTNPQLFELIHAADALKLTDLQELCCAVVAERMANSTVEEIRCMFGITSDFTDKEERNFRRERAEEAS
eukprot:TRINITY_DN32729_c0_g1_i1.p2 TRINITY_DN32729_c0_g1~~TRINITY_DN32729_c0_g1_i1.p2  ORF type:complete len:180 (+),score=94.44 TRINITY_DN32729_c0_g1_i1:53-541(+)